jgi:hypothetical protein
VLGSTIHGLAKSTLYPSLARQRHRDMRGRSTPDSTPRAMRLSPDRQETLAGLKVEFGEMESR